MTSQTAGTDHYRVALEHATREYEEAIRQRADLDARIAQLAQTVGTLMRLCGLVPTLPWGLTDACRTVLKAAGHPLAATEVRAQLTAMGFDLSRYANDLSSIHIVLKRLTRAGEVQFRPRSWGKPGYQWNASNQAPGGQRVFAAAVGKPRRWPKRPTGEGLCPPKDRKK